MFIANSYRNAAEHHQVIVEDLSRILNKAQQFTINVFDHELRQLDKNGGLESCLDGLDMKKVSLSSHLTG
ncbi:hypothetical protein [Paenibacillus marinisediminis]